MTTLTVIVGVLIWGAAGATSVWVWREPTNTSLATSVFMMGLALGFTLAAVAQATQ